MSKTKGLLQVGTQITYSKSYLPNDLTRVRPDYRINFFSKSGLLESSTSLLNNVVFQYDSKNSGKYDKDVGSIQFVTSFNRKPTLFSYDARNWGDSLEWMNVPLYLQTNKLVSIKKSNLDDAPLRFEVLFKTKTGFSLYFLNSSLNYLPEKIIKKNKENFIVSIQNIQYMRVGNNWFPKESKIIEREPTYIELNEFLNSKLPEKTVSIANIQEFKILNKDDKLMATIGPKFPTGTEVHDSVNSEIYTQK